MNSNPYSGILPLDLPCSFQLMDKLWTFGHNKRCKIEPIGWCACHIQLRPTLKEVERCWMSEDLSQFISECIYVMTLQSEE